MTRYYKDMMPGDVFDYHGTTVEVLGPHEPYQDMFGRDMWRFWARRADTGDEGWIPYGPGGCLSCWDGVTM